MKHSTLNTSQRHIHSAEAAPWRGQEIRHAIANSRAIIANAFNGELARPML
jgi:hypothetical protein